MKNKTFNYRNVLLIYKGAGNEKKNDLVIAIKQKFKNITYSDDLLETECLFIYRCSQTKKDESQKSKCWYLVLICFKRENISMRKSKEKSFFSFRFVDEKTKKETDFCPEEVMLFEKKYLDRIWCQLQNSPESKVFTFLFGETEKPDDKINLEILLN